MKDIAKFVLTVLSGAFFIAGFPHEFALIPTIPHLIWVAFIPLFIAVRIASTPREAFLIGYLFGVIVNSALLIWLMSFGPMPVILLALVFSLIFAFITLFAWYMFDRVNPLHWWWMLPTFSAAILFFVGVGFWGFPWVYPAYSLAKSPLFIQTCDIGGVTLVNWLIVFINIAVYQMLIGAKHKHVLTRTAVIAITISIAAATYSVIRISSVETGESMTVALVQGGIESDVEWTEQYNLIARRTYIAATERALKSESADLIIWPESSIGDIVSRDYKFSIPLQVRLLPEKLASPLLFGTLTAGKNAYYNSAVLIDEQGEIAGVVDKSVLIAFGEVLPFRRVVRFVPFPWGEVDIDRLDSMSLIQVPIETQEGVYRRINLATAICFDSVKPYILRDKTKRGAQLIAIITNNSWYKKPSGTEQHRMMDVFRAVENRRWTIRVSTTGVSHVVDPAGRIVAETDQFRYASLIERVELLDDQTIYTRFGDWFGWSCLICAVFCFIWVLLLGESYDFF